VYFGCDACGHLWNLPKRGREPSAQLEIDFLQTDGPNSGFCTRWKAFAPIIRARLRRERVSSPAAQRL